MWKWDGRVLALTLVMLASGCGDNKDDEVTPGFKRMGGEANAHFVYLDETRYQGATKWSQMQDSLKLCDSYGDSESCDVYIWTAREDVAKALPLVQRDRHVGWFALRGGQPAYFKEVNQREVIENTYGTERDSKRAPDNSAHAQDRMRYYGGFVTPARKYYSVASAGGPRPARRCEGGWADWWRNWRGQHCVASTTEPGKHASGS